jgi:hypothetical protein
MTLDKVKAVTAFYRGVLAKARNKELSHASGMLDSIDSFMDEGRREKAFRWLGFVQGVLWVRGVYSIDQLKEHNRPDGQA